MNIGQKFLKKGKDFFKIFKKMFILPKESLL